MSSPLLNNPKYKDFCIRYRDNLVRYVVENSRHRITWQQYEMVKAMQKPGCSVAVSSGHGTGKSFCLAWALDWHLRAYPYSNAMITATNIVQVRSVIWKELDSVIVDVNKLYPWMTPYFVKEAQRYYALGAKDSWYIIPKTTSKGNPENMAGQHGIHYMCIVDEASGVADEIHGVLRGALTHPNNRYVMVSQPTRPVGHFADAFGKLKDMYTTLQFNSEESPIVCMKFIREKLIEYGGHHSPEYQIKVLGRLPDNLTGYLIPKSWCEKAQSTAIEHKEAWGWVLTVDVAEGVHRDSSVWTLAKVSGYGAERRIEVVEYKEYQSIDEKVFAREIYSVIQDYQSLTVAVDADGCGRTVILELEELGVTVERIHWGLPPHSDADKKRYKNQRAYASVKVREAIFEERMRIGQGKKVVEQACRIPYKIDEGGRYQILPKDQMKAKGIKSPDIFDTHCFFFLVDYVPAESMDNDQDDELIKAAMELLEQ
ncbi:MAG: protein PacB [Desulfobacterales bacterium]|nr:protein PacB [Desulfobacterales bacterium]